ncbi:MAG: thiamine pyrophosphate-binding protein, partial [Chloroflexi bacterium]|nr:thiamine pyrophosphate-binding protein [Chloroflexota bacterium]
MTKAHGGQLVARSLKREGIDLIFSLPGKEIDHIYDACIDENIRIIDVRHEQAAAAMADGWTRVTGRPAVVVVAGMPAVVAMMAGIRNAEFSPVIAISGKTDLSRLERGLPHEMDQLAVMSPITKWARTVYETRRIPEYIASSFR